MDEISRLAGFLEGLVRFRDDPNAYKGRMGGDDDQACLTDLLGNIARISFRTTEGETLGADWIGASAEARKAVHKYIQDFEPSTKLVVSYRDGTFEFDAPSPSKPFKPFKPRHPSTQTDRFRDSEYALLNMLSEWLFNRQKPAGHLLLITERIPCASCTSVLTHFLQVHTNVTATVHFLFDTIANDEAREAWDFTADVKDLKKRLTLEFTQIEKDTAHTVDVSDLRIKLEIAPELRQRISPEEAFRHASIQSSSYSGPKNRFGSNN